MHLSAYQMVTEKQPTLEPSLKPTLNPHWNPHWKIPLLGFPPTNFGFTKSRWWWHEWNELHVWFDEYFWDSNYKDTTKTFDFQIFENICHNSSDKVLYVWTIEDAVEHLITRRRLPVEGVTRTVVVNHVPHERIFVNAVFSVVKT